MDLGRSGSSDLYTMSSAANAKMNNALKSYGAATFGSYARRAERLARFKAAEQKKKAAQTRLKTAIRTEQARVAERSTRRRPAPEISANPDANYETAGRDAEAYLTSKVKEAWATYIANDTQETLDAWWIARCALSDLNHYPANSNPLHILANTAQMLSECDSDSDSEDSDYTE